MPATTSILRFMQAPRSGEFALSDQKGTPAVYFTQFPPKPRDFSVLFTSLHDHNNSSLNNLENLLQNASYLFSKRSPLLARSISSTQFSYSVSDSDLRVAYQGVPGAFSEEAAKKAYPNCQPVPYAQFDSAFQAVENGSVDRAVLPIENSTRGSIHRNYDLLLRHSLHIVGEVNLSIFNHPQALAHSENRFIKLGLSKEDVHDTVLAAKRYPNNFTRFLMLAREPIIADVQKPYKTSIVFSLEEGPGVLFKALAVFAFRKISLIKIESRPLSKQPTQESDDGYNSSKDFDYLFHVDFEASITDKRVQFALKI